MSATKSDQAYRKTAIIVGALFMLAIATLFIGQAFYNPILSSPDYLENAHPNRGVVIMGILIEMIGILGLVLIPVLLFPVLKKHYEVMALGYMGFRLFEAVLLSFAQVYKLALVNLSGDYLNMGEVDPSHFQYLGSSIKSVLYWIDSAGLIYVVVFVTGALLLNSSFYISNLIPRWLSIWGIVGALAILAASIMATFDAFLGLAMLLIFPIALQEQVMAIWLIAKGFNPAAISTESE